MSILRRAAHACTDGPEALAGAGTVFVLDGDLFCSRESGCRPPALFFGVYGDSEKGDFKGKNPGRKLASNHSREIPPNIKERYDMPAFPRQHHLAFSLLEP